MSSKQRQRLEKWLSEINISNGDVADVGGCQNPIKGRIKHNNVSFDSLDLSEPHECKRKPDYKLDLNKLNKENGLVKCEYYDFAFCIEVMEYIYDPITAIKNLNNILKKGGELYITFPFLYPIHKPTGEDFMRYTIWGVRKILKEGGFEIKEENYSKMEDRSLTYYMGFLTSEGMRFDKDFFADNKDCGKATEYMIKAIKLNEI